MSRTCSRVDILRNVIRFGVGPAAFGDARKDARDRAAKSMSSVLGDAVEIVAIEKYPDLFAELDKGKVDLAWLPPILCVRAEDAKHVLLLDFVRESGTLYHGALFVSVSAKRWRPEDLAGTTIAWVDESSCGGYLFPRASLVERGIHPRDLFTEEKVLGSHSAVVAAVENGSVDCGAAYLNSRVDGSTRAAWKTGTMRCVLVSRPIPSDAIAAHRSFGNVDRVKTGLRKIDADVMRDLFDATRLDPIESNHYDVVREALKVAG